MHQQIQTAALIAIDMTQSLTPSDTATATLLACHFGPCLMFFSPGLFVLHLPFPLFWLRQTITFAREKKQTKSQFFPSGSVGSHDSSNWLQERLLSDNWYYMLLWKHLLLICVIPAVGAWLHFGIWTKCLHVSLWSYCFMSDQVNYRKRGAWLRQHFPCCNKERKSPHDFFQ